jgi:hypothetical protein
LRIMKVCIRSFLTLASKRKSQNEGEIKNRKLFLYFVVTLLL